LKVRAEEEAKQWREKRALEEEVRQTKNYLQSILDNSLDLIFTVRKDGTFGYVNPQLEKITGYSKNQFVGKHFMEFIPEHRKEFMLEKWREMNEGISGTYETEIIKADGTLMQCLVSHSIVEGFDEFLVLLKDITERKRVEEELKRRMEELERFNRLAVGRELKMIELKKRIQELESEKGK
jgi:PAS domain S-box-containing protein